MKFTKENTLQLKGIAVIFLLYHHLFNSPSMYQNFEFAFMVWKELCQFFCIFISVWSRGILYETVRKKGSS